jgi:hypothetical protein
MNEKDDLNKENNKNDEVVRDDVLEKFIALENKRIDVERQREENVAKELEYSAKSGEDAKEIASQELEIQNNFLNNSWQFKNRIILYAFISALALIGVFTFLTIQLSTDNQELLDRIYSFFIDALKIAGGFIVGYLLKASRKNNNKKREQTD